MTSDNTAPISDDDAMAAEWAAALAEAKPSSAMASSPAVESQVQQSTGGHHDPFDMPPQMRDEQVSPASFSNFGQPGSGAPAPVNDINMILDIPVQLTVELGRTRIPIKHILQLAQGSVVELEALAGEPMDVLVNGFLIAQGEVVVVNDKFGIRLTDIVTPSERMRRLSRA
jgi:flagellar motor switch protein FliN/FliY